MTETPLHKAAANNHVEILKFLLEWQGEDKAELEAKNMVILPSFTSQCRNHEHGELAHTLNSGSVEFSMVVECFHYDVLVTLCFSFCAVWRDPASSCCEKWVHRGSEASVEV
jgi:hypothetical protein